MTDETPPAPEVPAEAAAAEADGPPRVAFAHSFFTKAENAHFCISEMTGDAVMVVSFAKNVVSLPIKGIKKEFALDGTPDGAMLDLVDKGLKYVKGLRIGDLLPSEILTREASWELSERHLTIAYQRVAVQLVNWMTGGEVVITDPDALVQLAEDPQTKKNVNKAFEEAAEQLGIGRENKQQVIDHVQTLAHELAYIEALRDRFRHVTAMDKKIQGLRRLYGREKSVLDIADQVARLAEQAVKEFSALFFELDAQTGEILSVLRNLTSQIDFIRDRRDELHIKLMAWDEILAEWDEVQVKADPDKPELLRRAYHFLAPRFMMVNEWVLMSQAKIVGAEGISQLAAETKKKPVHVMRW